MPADDVHGEILQQRIGQVKVRHRALAQGADSQHVAGGAADHAVGIAANGENLFAVPLNGHHRGLPQHDALAFHVEEHVGSAQVDADVIDCSHVTFPFALSKNWYIIGIIACSGCKVNYCRMTAAESSAARASRNFFRVAAPPRRWRTALLYCKSSSTCRPRLSLSCGRR